VKTKKVSLIQNCQPKQRVWKYQMEVFTVVEVGYTSTATLGVGAEVGRK
jgi:hypothetical protein